jgi:hypothetical protein
MQYLPELDSNFKVLKNRPLCLEDGERFIIKHCVYFEGTKEIKISITRIIDDMEEITMTESEFKSFVKRLKAYRKNEEQ